MDLEQKLNKLVKDWMLKPHISNLSSLFENSPEKTKITAMALEKIFQKINNEIYVNKRKFIYLNTYIIKSIFVKKRNFVNLNTYSIGMWDEWIHSLIL